MFSKALTLTAVAAMALGTLAPAMAEAHERGHGRYEGRHDDRYRPGDYYRGGYDRSYGGGYYDGRHQRRVVYERPRYRHDRHRCDSGTGGTIIGAVTGGLIGNEVGRDGRGRGDGGTATIIGAGIGALLGRAIDRDC